MAKVVAFNGSPRKDGNTTILIGHMFEELENEGIETELVQVGKKKIRGCTACMKCFENKDGHCVFDDDIVNSCIDKMVEADGIILRSPVYFLDVTAEMKGLIDRAGFVSMANGGLYRRRVGMAVAAVPEVRGQPYYRHHAPLSARRRHGCPGLPGPRCGKGDRGREQRRGRHRPCPGCRKEHGLAHQDHEESLGIPMNRSGRYP